MMDFILASCFEAVDLTFGAAIFKAQVEIPINVTS